MLSASRYRSPCLLHRAGRSSDAQLLTSIANMLSILLAASTAQVNIGPPLAQVVNMSKSPTSDQTSPAPRKSSDPLCKACQGGRLSIDPHHLAVLHPGFKRDRMEPWRTTSILTDDRVNAFPHQHRRVSHGHRARLSKDLDDTLGELQKGFSGLIWSLISCQDSPMHVDIFATVFQSIHLRQMTVRN